MSFKLNPIQRPTGWLTALNLLFFAVLFSAFSTHLYAQPSTITVGGTTYQLDGNNALKWVTILKSNDPSIVARTFRRDANNTNDDQWTGGSADPDLAADWYWVSGNTNDKGDISNAGAVLIGKTIYFFGDRTAVNGDAQIAFWFFLGGIQQNCTKGKGGFRFSGANAEGDVLAISNFINGGGTPSLTVYKRDANQNLVADNSAQTWIRVNTKTIDAPNTATDPNWKFSHTDACAGTTGNDYWTFTPKTGADQTYPAPLFFEGAIDFSNETSAKLCFNRFLLETRNSQSLSASLQDFVAGEFNVTPKPPKVTDDEKCFDKQPVNLTASCSSPGSSPRWYKKNTDGSYTLLTTADGVSSDGSTLTKSGLPVGTTSYYVSCYNATLGCESDKVEVKAIIDGLPTVDGVVTEGENDNSIDDGITKVSDDVYQIRISKTGTASLSATGSGGVGPYTYQWTALDANAAISFTSTGANGTFKVLTTSGLNASYSFKVTVTDSKNCQSTDVVEIRPFGSCPPCGIIGPATSCKDASVTYTYGDPNTNTPFATLPADFDLTWTLPDGTTVKNVKSVTVTLSSTGSNKVSISFKSTSGLMDNCPGCSTTTDTRQVTCTAAKINDVRCNGESNGSAKVTPANGFEPYTYKWDNGETTQTATALNKGTHTVTVTDAKNCTTTCTVDIAEPPLLTCTVKLDANTDCFVNNGKATVTPVGGNGGYTYKWDNGETTQQAVKLSAGKHTVTVTDAKGCTTSCDVTVPENPCQHIFCTNTTCLDFINTTQVLPNICYNTQNGTITPGVFYYWTNVTAPSANFTIKVLQSNTTGSLPFLMGNGNQFNLQTGTSCGSDGSSATFAETTTATTSTVTVTVKGAQAGKTYILGVKYGAKSGETFSTASTFTFVSQIGGVDVSGSKGTITVKLDCSATCVNAGTLVQRNPATQVITTEPVKDLQVQAYPNPFNNVINFTVVSPVSGKANLEIFDMVGRKLAVVYDGNLDANTSKTINYKVPNAHMVPMIYRVTVGDRSTRGTLLPGRQEP